MIDTDYLPYFNFFFSHVDKDVKMENLKARIEDILDKLNANEKLNLRLVAFLKHIIKKA